MNLSKSLLVLTLSLVMLVALAYPASAGRTNDYLLNPLASGSNLTGCDPATSWDITAPGYYWFNSSVNVSYSGQGCINIRTSGVILSCTPNPLYGSSGYNTISNIGNASASAAGINITQSDADTSISVLQNITIQNCTIAGWNGAQGAGIFVGGFAWNVTFANVTFINNTVGLNVTGSAFGINASVGNLNITRNHFTNNSAYHIWINNSFYSATYPICGSCYYNLTNITVNNFTNGNATSFIAAIFLGNGSNSTIYRNNFSNLTNGIIAWNVTRFNITENNLSFINKTAIALYSSANNFNGSNNISNNTIWGVNIGTTFWAGGAWGEAAGIRINSSNNTISFNIINVSNHSGINVTLGGNFTNITSNVILNVTSVGIALSQVVGSNVSGNNITALAVGAVTDTNTRGYGIWITRSNFTTVVYNFVNYSNFSIRVQSANTTNITNNTFNNTVNGSAIWVTVLSASNAPNSNVTISYNMVGNTTYSGSLLSLFGAIHASSIDGVNITNNIIINTTGVYGILVNNSFVANVSHNDIRQVNATWHNINISGVDNLTLVRNDIRESGFDGILINGSSSPRIFYNTILVAGRDALSLYNVTGGNVSENNLSESSSGIRAGFLGDNGLQVNDTLFQDNNLTGNAVGLNLTQINHSRFENTRIWNSTSADQRFGNANITHYNVSTNMTNVSLQTALSYYNVSYVHPVNVTVYEAQGALAQGATVDFLGNSLGSIITAATNLDGNASLNLTVANQSNTAATLSTTNFSAFNITAGLPSMNGSISPDMAVGQFDALKAFSILMTFRNGANMTSCANNSLAIDTPGSYWFNATGAVHVGSYSHHGGNCISIQTSNVIFSCSPNPIYDVGAGGISRLQYFQVGTRANASSTAVGINVTAASNGVLQNITIQNCTITGFNGTRGAGILVAGHVWNLSIANVTFTNNTVGLNITGGNVTAVSPVGNLNITRNHFTNNTAYHLIINISSAVSSSTYFNITNITVNNFTNGNFSTFIAAIFLVNGSNSTIYRNNFSNVTAGVIGWNLTRFNVTENNFSLINRSGVALWASASGFNGSNNISNNTVFNVTGSTNVWGEVAGISVNGSNNTISYNLVNVSSVNGIVVNGSNSPNVFYNTVLSATRDAFGIFNVGSANVSENNFSLSGSGIHAGLGIGDASYQVNSSLFQNNNVSGNVVGLNLTQIVGSRFENTRIWNSSQDQQRFGNANITHYNASVNVTNVSLQASLSYYNVTYIHLVNVTVLDAGGIVVEGAQVDFLNILDQAIYSNSTNVNGNVTVNLTGMNQTGTSAVLTTQNFSGITIKVASGTKAGSGTFSDFGVGQFDTIKTSRITLSSGSASAAGGGGGGSGSPTNVTNATSGGEAGGTTGTGTGGNVTSSGGTGTGSGAQPSTTTQPITGGQAGGPISQQLLLLLALIVVIIVALIIAKRKHMF